ncbi:uncharacterized protein LOC120483683 isoform X2 [Pimephales promelas]|nr:uncharacterized protein LOC120483683 isoform X2 [Pimephales promelas]KAG1948661.1 hypothetical protein F2P79_012276 [Pimephales promelas]KAG1948662.1 hypothetical protein F2P79_012276 [Pimephales promelas]KAG1948663.1 hypothetical protein F2P79_012276 [Pimephales promelas]KAG1948664.1 hypothetical protein F2P79_012276 [Pimephales promelas]
MQDLWISVKQLIERISAEGRVKGHDDFIVALRIFQRLGCLYGDVMFHLWTAHENSGKFAMFKGIIKNETMVDLWKHVESRYLPGAPPIYSDPVGFLGHLLSKKMAQPHVVEILKVALEVVKIDFNSLFDEAQMAIHLVKEKAMEISTLEKQTEKDEFLITLRTASGVLAFYWDKLLEYTESQPFHNKYLAAVRKWKELNVLKDTEKYNMISKPETGLQAWTWADERFGDLFDNAALEYDRFGDGIFGDDRFNQSNWAIMKMATVYPLPIYERLSESGLGMSEVNDFFIGTDDTLTELLGEDILYNLKGVLNELWDIISNDILHISINKKNQVTSDVESEEPVRHLRKMKAMCFDIWDRVLIVINRNINNYELEQSARQWDEAKSIFIKELTESGELTQQKLDEAQKVFNSVTQIVFDKYVKMVDGLEERISASTETLGKLMLKAFSATNTVLVNTLVVLLSD